MENKKPKKIKNVKTQQVKLTQDNISRYFGLIEQLPSLEELNNNVRLYFTLDNIKYHKIFKWLEDNKSFSKHLDDTIETTKEFDKLQKEEQKIKNSTFYLSL